MTGDASRVGKMGYFVSVTSYSDGPITFGSKNLVGRGSRAAANSLGTSDGIIIADAIARIEPYETRKMFSLRTVVRGDVNSFNGGGGRRGEAPIKKLKSSPVG